MWGSEAFFEAFLVIRITKRFLNHDSSRLTGQLAKPTLTFVSLQFAEVTSTGIPKPIQNASWFACKGNTLCSWCHHCNNLKFKSDWGGSLSFSPCPPLEQPLPPPPVQHKTRATGALGLGKEETASTSPPRKLAALLPSGSFKPHCFPGPYTPPPNEGGGFTNVDFPFQFRTEQRLGTGVNMSIYLASWMWIWKECASLCSKSFRRRATHFRLGFSVVVGFFSPG